MSEKQSSFTVTDRRKFTLDGELRDPASAEETHESTPAASITPEASPAVEQAVLSASEIATGSEAGLADVDHPETDQSDEFLEEQLGPIPTSQESAAQHAAYQTSSRQLDEMIRQANPGAAANPLADFEQMVQSFYLSAAIAMGAAAEPGQQPRVDIIGARQSIDLLAVLADKTKGNLTDREQKLLQTALFNLRMMFLEITNSIAAQATKPKPGNPLHR